MQLFCLPCHLACCRSLNRKKKKAFYIMESSIHIFRMLKAAGQKEKGRPSLKGSELVPNASDYIWLIFSSAGADLMSANRHSVASLQRTLSSQAPASFLLSLTVSLLSNMFLVGLGSPLEFVCVFSEGLSFTIFFVHPNFLIGIPASFWLSFFSVSSFNFASYVTSTWPSLPSCPKISFS